MEEVPDPRIINPRDAIVRITATTICGSDLHLYDGMMAGMERGDILGHEPVGVVEAVGPEIQQLIPGDRVVVSPGISCGQCSYCRNQEYSLCDNSNPNAWMAEKLYGHAPAAIFGFTHIFGGYAGAQAEYLRVPFADVGALKIPDGMSDEQALACADAFPTGFMAADMCRIRGGDIVAVWGCGPIGLFAIKSAYLLGAAHVIAIDNVTDRLRMAAEWGKATVLNHDDVDVPDALGELTGGRGPDACIDAVGMESHGFGALSGAYDRAKQALMLETDRAHVVRQMIECCRKGGTLSVIGAYAMVADKIPLGAAFVKGLKLHTGMMHAQKYIPRLFGYWQANQIDPGRIFTHRMALTDAPAAYRLFRDKADGCVKVVLKPSLRA